MSQRESRLGEEGQRDHSTGGNERVKRVAREPGALNGNLSPVTVDDARTVGNPRPLPDGFVEKNAS